ncbi:MarR family winged helix-turn-helix transcriptional regulator (plasmid) [Rhodococcus globerulus]|uniref:MarR family winged helix-turn-helix transcriptional regulator n=1 Tax=Rhodococcus globerulus TaxID=33008 RepID=UPI0039EC4693
MAAKPGKSATRSPASPTMVMILQARALEAKVEAGLKSIDLSLRRLGLLGHLQREPGISFSALARRAGIKVQSLHPIVDAMIADGYANAVGGVGQGRAASIRLTDRGVEALARANTLIAEFDASEFANEEWAELGVALSRIGEAWLQERLVGTVSTED